MTNVQEFAPNGWIADGPLARAMGLAFTTPMTIVKLSSCSVWVEGPVPLPFETLRGLAELGPICYAVAASARPGPRSWTNWRSRAIRCSQKCYSFTGGPAP
jgi:hypothetical protein